MAITNLISPGVEVKEIDNTASLGAVALGGGAIAGDFQWGPVNEITNINTEAQLVDTFGKPTSAGVSTWLSAASFLAYTGGLSVVRTVGTGATNAVVNGSTAKAWLNSTDYDDSPYTPAENDASPFIARYPGELGDGILISIVDKSQFSTWTYKNAFSAAPGTSANQTYQDCIHVIVIDDKGDITGVPGTFLEKFADVSVVKAATDDFGQSNYIGDRIKNEGKWVWFGSFDIGDFAVESSADDTDTVSVGWVTAGTTALGAALTALTSTVGLSFKLTGGSSGTSPGATAAREAGYELFADADTTDVSFLIGGDSHASNNANAKITTITSSRKDAFGFISPPSTASSVNLLSSTVTLGAKADALVTWSASHGAATSYMVVDSGYKKMYNKYDDKYVAVPLNGDIAGIAALTRESNDAWWSPAGEKRGQVRSLAGLYFNPGQSERDKLYPVGINPVISTPGRGTFLFGDKTGQLGNGAFTRINVRGLFIVLEKTISNFAKSLLFEFNDEFTRSTFRSLVGGYLENVQSRRGISDFQVVCDETNNTAAVVDANEFVGDIFIKPSRSINFIRLNFVAVRSGVEFSELIG